MSKDYWHKILKEKATYLDFKGFVDYVLFSFNNFNGYTDWFKEEFKKDNYDIVTELDGHFFIDVTQFRNLYTDLN